MSADASIRVLSGPTPVRDVTLESFKAADRWVAELAGGRPVVRSSCVDEATAARPHVHVLETGEGLWVGVYDREVVATRYYRVRISR